MTTPNQGLTYAKLAQKQQPAQAQPPQQSQASAAHLQEQKGQQGGDKQPNATNSAGAAKAPTVGRPGGNYAQKGQQGGRYNNGQGPKGPANQNPKQQSQNQQQNGPVKPSSQQSVPKPPAPATPNQPLSFAAAAAAKANAPAAVPTPPKTPAAAPSATETPAAEAQKPVEAAEKTSGSNASATDALKFKPNVATPVVASAGKPKLRFGSQAELAPEQSSEHVPPTKVAEKPTEAPSVPVVVPEKASEVQQPIPAPMALHPHARTHFAHHIPRTASAPPQLDKNNQPILFKQAVRPPIHPMPMAEPAQSQAPAPVNPADEAQKFPAAAAPVVNTPAAPPMVQPPHQQGYALNTPQQPLPYVPQPHQQPQFVPTGAIPPQQFHGNAYNQGQPSQHQHFRSSGRPPSNVAGQSNMPNQYQGGKGYPKGPNTQYTQQIPGAMPPIMGGGPFAAGPQGYGYQQPFYNTYDPTGIYQGQQFYPPPTQQYMFRPPNGPQPVIPGPQQRLPQPSAGSGTPSFSVPPPKVNKAIAIVNPNTKEVVTVNPKVPASPSPATAPTPAPATPAAAATVAKPDVVKEKAPVSITLTTPTGQPLDFKSPAKPAETAPATKTETAKTETTPAVAPKVEARPIAAPGVAKNEEPKKEQAKTVEAKKEDVKKEEEPVVVKATAEKVTPAAVSEPKTVEKPAAPVKPAEPVVTELKAVDVKEEKKAAPAPVAAPAAVKEAAKPKPAEKELEEGEIVEPAKVDGKASPAIAKQLTEEPKAEKPTAKAVADPNRPITILKSFEGVQYPEGLAPPQVVDGVFKYVKDFLLAFSAVKEKPAGLPNMESFLEEGKASPYTSRPSSGSGSFYGNAQGQGSFGAGGKRPSGGGYPHGKGMITVPAPSGMRGMPGRMPISGSGSGMGGQNSGRGSGSWDKGQGLPPRPGAGGRGYRGPPPQAPIEPPVEPLKISENAWTPDLIKKKTGKAATAVAPAPASEEEKLELQCEELAKKVKGLLNKLTLEKFDKISDQLINLDISHPLFLKKTIALIFEKALDEYHFQAMYGRLCVKLSNELPRVQSWIGTDMKSNVFRRLLLNKCQEEFEKNDKWSQGDAAGAESRRERLEKLANMTSEEKQEFAEEEYQRTKLKRKVLGNIGFIGELFKLDMITEKIMHSCVGQLLYKLQEPEEEEAEALCKLLKGVGGKLDHERARGHMDAYFTRIKELSVHPKLTSRIKFMLEDLIDQRKNHWKARQEAVGPMTIAQIHMLAEKKAREEEEARQRNSARGGRGGRGGGPGGYGRQNSMGGGSRGGPQDARVVDGWTAVDKSKAARQVDDNMNRVGKFDSVKKKGDVFSFAPQSVNWSKGAQGGAAKEDDKKTAAAPSSNKFSVLLAGNEPTERKTSSDAPTGARSVSPVPPKDVPKKVTKNQAAQKIKSMTEEWLSVFDVAEVETTVTELGSSEYHMDVLSSLLMAAFDKKTGEVEKTADLIVSLVNSKVISQEDVKKCILQTVGELEDIAIDIPGVFDFMGIILGRLCLIEDSIFTLSSLTEVLAPLMESRSRIPPTPKVIGELFKTIRKVQDEDTLVEMFTKEGLELSVFWPATSRSDDVIADWAEKYSLDCLNPTFKLVRGIKSRLGKDDSDALISWIESTFDEELTNSMPFLRALTISILRYLGSKTIFANGTKNPQESTREMFVKQEEIIVAHKALFTKFVSENGTNTLRELEVLFACQAYWAESDSIKSFLEHLFRIFHKNDIVDPEALFAWESNTKREASSKAGAVEEVSSFLKSLKA
ncbi:hypothetical protein HDV05_005272 [Chytridiales sp. JEL 0842]|nr:hypothetical protein HDV05_005272 [Chytridiales sp. JEL 0842]